MKIIQAQKVSDIEDILEKEGKSIVVFPENSFNKVDKNYLKEISLNYKSTLIGTCKDKIVCKNELLKIERALMIKKGERFSTQYAFPWIEEKNPENLFKIWLFGSTDKFYNVSPNENKVMALIRICSDMNKITRADGKADLLIIPSAIYHKRFFKIDNLKKNLKNDALVVYSIKDNQKNSGIFNLDLEQIGIEKRNYKFFNH